MKTINIKLTKYLVGLLALLLLFSCEDRLEEEAFSVITPDNFYNNKEEGYQALQGIIADYGSNGAFRRDIFYIMNLRSDDHNLGRDGFSPDRTQMDHYGVQPTNSLVFSAYDRLYTSIFRANSLIEGLEATAYETDDEIRLEQIAEAKFYRAFNYFFLTRFFGRLTIVTSSSQISTISETPRSSIDEVYELIIEDFTAAKNGLPGRANVNSKERPSSMSAAAYLAKVHLTRGNYNEAAASALEVINSGEYDLFDDYEDIFRTVNQGGIEHIFSIAHSQDFNNNIQPWWSPRNLPGGGGKATINREVLLEFDTLNDLRLNATFRRDYEDIPLTTADLFTLNEFSMSSNKWYFDGDGVRSMDYPILRFADVLLMYAEAVNEGGTGSLDKFEALNRVRNRAGLEDLSGLDPEAFREAIIKERRLEFVSEGKRYFDLQRWGLLEVEINAELSAKGLPAIVQLPRDLYLPIPQNELDVYPALDQNPGY